MTLPGWRIQAPGDLVYVREGAPMFDNASDVPAAATVPPARVQMAEMGIVVAVDDETTFGSTARPVCIFLSKRMRMMWVDMYWCSRI